MSAALEIVRFLHLAATTALFGIGAFRIYAFAGDTGLVSARAGFDALLARATAICAIAALLSALAMVPCAASEMSGFAAAAIDPAIVSAVLFATEFGHAWCWHIGFAGALLLVLCVVVPPRWRTTSVPLVALLLLASLGWVGHATEDEGAARAAHQVNQMLHLAAAGVWLGGLVPLGLLLERARRPDGGAYASLVRLALPHFSQIGVVAVALLALTGTINSVFLVGGMHALTMTPYGHLLTLKIALFAAMVALAAVNRMRFTPRLREPASGVAPLRALFRSVMVEQMLGLAILAVVAVLGTWPPAIHAAMAM